MSEEAIRWVSEWAPVPSHLVGTLLGIAIYADKDGCGSFPGQKTIAWHARKSDRQVRNDLLCLENDLKLIGRGDQSLAEHIAADERPVVWNLAMDRQRDPRPERERKWTSARYREGAEVDFRSLPHGNGSGLPPEQEAGREADFRPNDASGSELPPQPEGAEGGFRPNAEGSGSGLPTKKKRMTSSSSLPAVTRIAGALDISDTDARGIWDRFVADPSVRAPSRYVDSLIASGDIAKHRPAPKVPAAATTHPYEDSGRGYCAKCHMPEKHARHGGRK